MAPWRGEISQFDRDLGTGIITCADGTELFFHGTAIANGSRNIEVGEQVEFSVVAGHRRPFEAADIRPVTFG